MSRESIQKQLKQLDVEKLIMNNGNSVAEELKRHAAILANCILKELDKVYESYEPKIYNRTYNLYNSLDVERTVRIDVSSSGAKLSIGVYFDDGAMHESFSGKMVNTAWLIDDGWQTHGRFASVPMFGYRKASFFIEKGIEQYKQSVKNPFAVKLRKGKEVTYF